MRDDTGPGAEGAAGFEERCVRLESHVAELERLVDELNGVVVEQARRLHRLEQRHHAVAASVEAMELDRIRANNPKPPHSVI